MRILPEPTIEEAIATPEVWALRMWTRHAEALADLGRYLMVVDEPARRAMLDALLADMAALVEEDAEDQAVPPGKGSGTSPC